LLATAPPVVTARAPTVVAEAERETRRPMHFDAGAFAVTVLNGVCGDPVIVLRPRGSRRVLLLDLGEAATLSRRVMHRVTDVFVSHAHFDHVAGFQWLVRARMGSVVPACRVFGPPGMHGHMAGMLAAVCWDRIGAAGPEFQVGEVHADRIHWVRMKAGAATVDCGSEPVRDGVLLEEPGMRVSAIELDHGIPVLSFAVESGGERRIRKERLEEIGQPAGPWLGALERRLERGDTDALIELPNGRAVAAGELAKHLVIERPRVRLVYATDFAETPQNRARLIEHARCAEVLICEATFLSADADQAARTQHLTARACGEIAAAAQVARLIPIHFSKRYENRPEAVYAEIRAASAEVALQELQRGA
jgi:ribonuclease BN (tRNA processing enzyme)